MCDDVLEELQIGRDAAHAEFPQRAVHPRRRLAWRMPPCGDLHQQGVVEWGNDRARVGGAAIETHAEAGRAAISRDTPVVGRKPLLRILGGDTALHRMPVQANVLLARQQTVRIADGCPFADADLRFHDVNACHFLRNGVLDLNARIHLDEVELPGIGVHQELDGAGVGILRCARDL